jgi:hypothetical protein
MQQIEPYQKTPQRHDVNMEELKLPQPLKKLDLESEFFKLKEGRKII